MNGSVALKLHHTRDIIISRIMCFNFSRKSLTLALDASYNWRCTSWLSLGAALECPWVASIINSDFNCSMLAAHSYSQALTVLVTTLAVRCLGIGDDDDHRPEDHLRCGRCCFQGRLIATKHGFGDRHYFMHDTRWLLLLSENFLPRRVNLSGGSSAVPRSVLARRSI